MSPELELITDITKNMVPMLSALLGVLIGGIITYKLNKQKIESEQKAETIKDKRNHLRQISNCFTDFENQCNNLAVKMDIQIGANTADLTDKEIEDTRNKYLAAHENIIHIRGIIRILKIKNLEYLLTKYALTANQIAKSETKERRSKILQEMKIISKETFELLSNHYN